MCRIVGFWDFNNPNYDKNEVLLQMRQTMVYGGPDAGGAYVDERECLGLGHRRLSILDLSSVADQPMHWRHWVMVFNGEIYNFEAIRLELKKKGFQFKTSGDTEVILKAFEVWGKAMVQRFRGMFTIVIWDKQKKEITIFRDRIGVKPLYWYWKDGLFMFASELKAFHQHPKFDKTINPRAVSLFLQQGYIQHPHCIFQYAHKLKAGSCWVLNKKMEIQQASYWNVQQVYEQAQPSQRSEGDLVEELEHILRDSFRLRMVADVPVGAFLSGGLDSSIVCSLLQDVSNRQLNTFTIGFHQEEYNEAKRAKAIASYLGTQHHELYCTAKDFEAVVVQLADFYDEPFGDSSAIPSYLVSKLAKQHVRVSLSADGGDEIFGGYTKYEIAKNYYPKIAKYPNFVRASLSKMASWVSPTWLDRNSRVIPILRNYKHLGNKFSKFRNALKAKNLLDFFNFSSIYSSVEDLAKLHETYQPRFDYEQVPDKKSNRLISFLGMVDIDTYLEGDIMTKVDRASMQVALEAREPFLDHKIIEFGMQLPDSLKLQGKTAKYLLRQVLYKYLPKDLIEGPKQGFSIPIQAWLLGSLKSNLMQLKEDKKFMVALGLQASRVADLVNQFTEQRTYVNPHFIWFLHVLHRWYLRWIA